MTSAVFTRRDAISLLSLGGLATFWGQSGYAMGQSSLLRLALLEGLCTRENRDSGVERLMWEASKRTSMLTDETPHRLRLEDAALYEHPLLILSGSGPLNLLSEKTIARLRHFLKLGGTLFVDDASPMGDDRFDTSFRESIQSIWPDAPLKPMAREHTFYLN